MIKQEIENLIEKALGKKAVVEIPDNLSFGDYSTNMAIKEKLNAQEVIEKIKKFQVSGCEFQEIFAKVEVVNGFINFFLKPEYFLDNLKQILKQKDKFGASNIGKGKTIVIDYSAPNIAKPFGIGHLRSTIIGQAIYNIYKFLGYKTIGDNHLGDWGTQFGKLIYQLKTCNLQLKTLTIEELEKMYVEFHQEAKDKLEMEDQARAWFKKLEHGDKQATKIWKICRKFSLKEFNRIYDLLGIKIDFALGESFYQNKMQEIFEEMKQKGLTKQSEGAWIVEFANNELPCLVLVKSDNATTYFLRDLATIKYRLKKWKPDIIAYEVGVDQTLHFKQLFKTIEMLGWAKNIKFEHISHGLMRSKTGKFSTRAGDTIHLENVLQEAIEKASQLSKQSDKELAKQVGIGAVKYNDLAQHHSRDIVFDWDKVLNLKGNSGPYLQYTFARTQSVLGKVFGQGQTPSNFTGLTDVEKIILKKLSRFPEIIERAASSFSPNLICNYVFELCQDFNLFYDTTPILKAQTQEQKQFRLALTFAVGQVIKNCLTLLGIESPKRM